SETPIDYRNCAASRAPQPPVDMREERRTEMELTIGTWRISVRRVVASESDVARLYDRTAWYWDSCAHPIAYPRAYFQLFQRPREDRPLAAAALPSRVRIAEAGPASSASPCCGPPRPRSKSTGSISPSRCWRGPARGCSVGAYAYTCSRAT